MQFGVLTDPVPVASLIAALVCGSLWLFGHAVANRPISASGTNRGAGYNTCCLGYDTARGEFSLAATACIFAPALLAVPLLPAAGVWCAGVIMSALGAWYVLGRRTSDPGGPRASRILRQPQWADKAWHMDAGWRCAVDKESHELSHAELPNGYTLTGEPAGRQTWHRAPRARGKEKAGFNPAVNPNSEDDIWRAQRVAAWKKAGGKVPDAKWVPTGPLDALRKAMRWYEVLQSDDGHWAGDYGGPHFLLPGMVVVWYVTGRLDAFLGPDRRAALAHYLRVHQQLDGGWGMHIESPSTMFGSVLCYIALRLLGEPHTTPEMAKAREFIRDHGGGLYTGSWAKFYMCLLGVMEWDGHNVIPAEMWLLPNWFPFHPGRLWCHCRMVYLPMCYLYGVKFVYAQAETDPLVAQLRSELYAQPYDTIRWAGTADHVADIDNYSPVHPLMRLANGVLRLWESYGGPLRDATRSRGLAFAARYMHAEDLQTNYVCIGPVNKVRPTQRAPLVTAAQSDHVAATAPPSIG